ncbi:hypothetical protein OKW34_002936 [Paraburkholderia youngii]|uniref:hypothetical protein n=1 Tax=Paraburkholderia TaxID=1822464 RepID=UPI003D191667
MNRLNATGAVRSNIAFGVPFTIGAVIRLMTMGALTRIIQPEGRFTPPIRPNRSSSAFPMHFFEIFCETS